MKQQKRGQEWRDESTIYYCKVFISDVVYNHLKADVDKLKMYTMNPGATNKITKQRVTANRPTDEIKYNPKNTQPKIRQKRGIKNRWDKQKILQDNRF